MATIEPFRGLRYDPSRVHSSDVIAPPYDVVDAAQVAALVATSPYNIALVESCPGEGEARYAAAAEALRAWTTAGVLHRDTQPSYYAYEQRFAVPGQSAAPMVTRRGFFARLRLQQPEDGVVRPHEATMSAAKEDRLHLMRATHANISPIFVMYADHEGAARAILDTVTAGAPAFEARDPRGDMHRLWAITDPAQLNVLTHTVASTSATIADGHHRYATALNFLAEREAAGGAAPAERSMLACMVAQEEPGLLILPIHRLICAAAVPADLRERLAANYHVESLDAPWDVAGAERVWSRVQADHDVPVFGVLGLTPHGLHLLTARSREAIASAMPPRLSAASRALDVLTLNETILQPALGLGAAARAAATNIAFTEDVREAWHAVDSGEYALAFLVRHVSAQQVVAIADAGELLPQKSTFFYPKLATGMVLNPLD